MSFDQSSELPADTAELDAVESLDLDAIAASFGEIESALRRLDDGTYFDGRPELGSDDQGRPD